MAGKVVEAGGYTLHVRSIAGIESCCYVDSIDVAFDLGCLIDRVVNKSHVFITHGHVDHIGALVAHAARRALQKQKPAKYFVPKHLVGHVTSILQSARAMQGDEAAFPAHLVSLEAFDEVVISPKLVVRAVPTTHRVPSLGYIVYEKKSVLKTEYKHLTRGEHAALKRSRTDVKKVEITPEIAYTGDTTIETFVRAAEDERMMDLLRVKVLITEATYVDSAMKAQDAVDRGHMHLDQLGANAHLFDQVGALVLVHFSARYKAKHVVKSVNSRVPPSLRQKTKLGC
uniref:Metallo-beta-lactamase domain-containing protein n=1 Tax=Peronospora matthiolae TaxID=2874970 RepID=A0AAV1SYY3_9STRA